MGRCGEIWGDVGRCGEMFFLGERPCDHRYTIVEAGVLQEREEREHQEQSVGDGVQAHQLRNVLEVDETRRAQIDIA